MSPRSVIADMYGAARDSTGPLPLRPGTMLTAGGGARPLLSLPFPSQLTGLNNQPPHRTSLPISSLPTPFGIPAAAWRRPQDELARALCGAGVAFQ